MMEGSVSKTLSKSKTQLFCGAPPFEEGVRTFERIVVSDYLPPGTPKGGKRRPGGRRGRFRGH